MIAPTDAPAPVRAPRGGSRGLRLGIIGFGSLAQRYYTPALRRLPGVAQLIVADPLPASRAAAARALPGITTHADAQALLAATPDAVVVATPPSSHLALWNDLAARRIPALIEKPFVLRGELERVARGPDVEPLLMINFNRRFWTPYARLADLVRGGAIGALGTVKVALHVDIAPWCTVTTHRLSAAEGGVLYDLGSQALDLAAAIAGAEPVRVHARGSSRRWTFDHVRLEAELAGGIRAVCDLAYEPRTSERVTAVGERGTLVLADPNMALHRVAEEGDAASARRRAADLATLAYYAIRRDRSMARHSIAAALGSFVTAVRSGAPFSPGFGDAARNAAWLEGTHLEVGP